MLGAQQLINKKKKNDKVNNEKEEAGIKEDMKHVLDRQTDLMIIRVDSLRKKKQLWVLNWFADEFIFISKAFMKTNFFINFRYV